VKYRQIEAKLKALGCIEIPRRQEGCRQAFWTISDYPIETWGEPSNLDSSDLICSQAMDLKRGLNLGKENRSAAGARYFDFYDLSPVGYISLNEQGLILAANLTGPRP